MADNDDGRLRARPRATLLLTRPKAASDRFAADLAHRELSLDIVISPLMEIVATGPTPPVPEDAELIFTSSNAVQIAGAGAGRRAWCVGKRTTEAASDAGFDAVMAGACAEELIARLLHTRPGANLVHFHGRHQRGDVVQRLSAAGLAATSQVIYDQVAAPPDAAFVQALSQSPLLVPLFSPRSADLFAKAAAPSWEPGTSATLLALSGAVEDALPERWRRRTEVVARPDGSAMLDAIERRIFP
jgi:uroporphyrinogen-III synthase